MDRFLVMETMYNLEVSAPNYEHGVFETDEIVWL